MEQKTPGNLEPEAWATLRRVLDLIEACKVEGDPQEIFAAIEEDLRARLAVPVDSKEPLQTVGNTAVMSTVRIVAGEIHQ